MRNPFICAALTKQHRKSHRMCWGGGGSGFEDDIERCEGDARRAGFTWRVGAPARLHPLSCPSAWARTPRGAPWILPVQTPKQPRPQRSRLLGLQNLLGNWNSWSLPELSGDSPTPESPAPLGTLGVGSRQCTGRCYYRNRAKHLTPGNWSWPFWSDYSKQDNPCLLRSLVCCFPFPLDVVYRFKGSSTALFSQGGAAEVSQQALRDCKWKQFLF